MLSCCAEHFNLRMIGKELEPLQHSENIVAWSKQRMTSLKNQDQMKNKSEPLGAAIGAPAAKRRSRLWSWKKGKKDSPPPWPQHMSCHPQAWIIRSYRSGLYHNKLEWTLQRCDNITPQLLEKVVKTNISEGESLMTKSSLEIERLLWLRENLQSPSCVTSRWGQTGITDWTQPQSDCNPSCWQRFPYPRRPTTIKKIWPTQCLLLEPWPPGGPQESLTLLGTIY